MGDAPAWVLTAIATISAVYFGRRGADSTERTSVMARLKDVEEREENREARLQMLERREVVHERREGILLDTLRRHEIAMPDLPDYPEAWSA